MPGFAHYWHRIWYGPSWLPDNVVCWPSDFCSHSATMKLTIMVLNEISQQLPYNLIYSQQSCPRHDDLNKLWWSPDFSSNSIIQSKSQCIQYFGLWLNILKSNDIPICCCKHLSMLMLEFSPEYHGGLVPWRLAENYTTHNALRNVNRKRTSRAGRLVRREMLLLLQ